VRPSWLQPVDPAHPGKYEAVRANPRRFAIVPGHEIPEVEDVVARNDRYIVVAKTQAPEAEIVQNTDPRRPLDD
jgi:hypothetical protein